MRIERIEECKLFSYKCKYCTFCDVFGLLLRGTYSTKYVCECFGFCVNSIYDK